MIAELAKIMTGKSLEANIRMHTGLPLNFFQPYQSGSDAALRAMSVITAPVFYTSCSVFFALRAMWELSFVLLIAAVFSPAINLVDLIGGGINTMVKPSSDATDHSYAPN